MTNNLILGSDPVDVIWDLILGEPSSISFNLFENEDLKPLGLHPWQFRGVLFNTEDHMLVELDYKVKNNTLTFFAPGEITAILNRPNYEKQKFVDFDVEGYSDEFDLTSPDNSFGTWTLINGRASVVDPNQ